jgi:glycosyltransferase involved in cell wall biosynthesis
VAEIAGPPRDSLLVFADDWGRHPSSCQHLMRQLLGRYDVYWVNTIGMRTPGLNLATVSRGLEKVRQWLRRSEPAAGTPGEVAPNPRVLNPRMWPWFSTSFGRWLNRRLLVRQLSPLVNSLPAPPLAVTTLPITSELIGLLPVRRWVYYCVDDFGQWPGLDQAALRRMEGRLIERADAVIAVSETLRDKLARDGRSAPLLTHGVDLDFWADPPEGGTVPEIEGLERPLVVFWGVVDRRMDVSYIARLAADLKQGTVVLVGPADDPDPALDRIPRVVRVPPLRFAQLPHLARAAQVLVMPYADLPVTRAIQPLKLKEYLATGKPAVVRDLPATRPWADCLDLADTPEAFSAAVRLRLQTGLPESQKAARARLAGESWAEKARAFERLALAPDAAAKDSYKPGALATGAASGRR